MSQVTFTYASYPVVILIGDDEIKLAITIEIVDHQRERVPSSSKFGWCAEASCSISRNYCHCIRRIEIEFREAHSQIEFVIAVEVADSDGIRVHAKRNISRDTKIP